MPAKTGVLTGKQRKKLKKLLPIPDFTWNSIHKNLQSRFYGLFLRSFNRKAMAVTRLKRKNRRDKAKSAVRRQSLKLQNFQPVQKTVDVEKIKEEFKTKKKV